jgi:hypothetical protein
VVGLVCHPPCSVASHTGDMVTFPADNHSVAFPPATPLTPPAPLTPAVLLFLVRSASKQPSTAQHAPNRHHRDAGCLVARPGSGSLGETSPSQTAVPSASCRSGRSPSSSAHSDNPRIFRGAARKRASIAEMDGRSDRQTSCTCRLGQMVPIADVLPCSAADRDSSRLNDLDGRPEPLGLAPGFAAPLPPHLTLSSAQTRGIHPTRNENKQEDVSIQPFVVSTGPHKIVGERHVATANSVAARPDLHSPRTCPRRPLAPL